MKTISQLDSNFKVEKRIDLPDARFFSIKKNPQFLYGLMFDEKGFFRMKEEDAESISDGVRGLCRATSGGRIRFQTDSPYVAIRVKSPLREMPPHISPAGCVGFDLYRNGRFCGFFPPPQNTAAGYESVVRFLETGKCEITVHFPLYSEVEEVEIGIREDALLEAAAPFEYDKRILFYGSSITQGACVSRAGLSYVNILANKLQCDVLNLGFSGNALGEVKAAEYIAKQNPDIFVMDYEHNAPTVAHLEKTHYSFYRAFRALCPKAPVLMLSSPDFPFKPESRRKRREVILQSFEKGKKDGDENLFFVDGETFYPKASWDACSVDTVHPNDLGHHFMAEALYPILKEILETC